MFYYLQQTHISGSLEFELTYLFLVLHNANSITNVSSLFLISDAFSLDLSILLLFYQEAPVVYQLIIFYPW